MFKVLFVTSTLARCGPTNQMHNLIRYLDRTKFYPVVVTLSAEPEDSLIERYTKLDLEIHQMNMGRLEGLRKAKSSLQQLIDIINPALVHSQGFRPDSLLSSMKLNVPWIATSRNYPWHDYPMKFGRLRGYIMAWRHIVALKKCRTPVACSKAIQKELQKHDISAVAIQNGVELEDRMNSTVIDFDPLEKPVFISVGSLIYRKNMEFLIKAFNDYSKDNKGSLLILGDGPLRDKLKASAGPKTYFVGNVKNVSDYLLRSDCFLSSSFSEGLPNTVLEALVAGLPVLLSDIPSHREIEVECSEACQIFSLESECELIEKMRSFHETSLSDLQQDAIRVAG